MDRYVDTNYDQMKMIPVSFESQFLTGSFEYSFSYLIDHELVLAAFDSQYRNGDDGRLAYDPRLHRRLQASSNASKSWSGLDKELRKKRQKIDRAIQRMLQRHQDRDLAENEATLYEREQEQIRKLRAASRKIKALIETESPRKDKERFTQQEFTIDRKRVTCTLVSET